MGDMEDLETEVTADADHPLVRYALEQGQPLDPTIQKLQRAARILRNLTNRVETLTSRGKQLEDRVTALEARLPPPP